MVHDILKLLMETEVQVNTTMCAVIAQLGER